MAEFRVGPHGYSHGWIKGGVPTPAKEPRSFQQALSTVKNLTSSGRLDYNPNLRTHIDAVKGIADVADSIPPGPRQQISDRIDRISVESEISVPGYRTPLGASVAGYYEPGSHALHVATDSGDTSHVTMHEMLHALDNNLQGGHRFSSRRDWLALCRSIWASEYAKTHARSYFVPSGPADMARAATETFAELLACHFEGKPLSLTYSGKTPLPPELERRVREFFSGPSGPAPGSRAVTESAQLPLCVGIVHADGSVEFVSAGRRTQAEEQRFYDGCWG